MASSASALLELELQADGENTNTWGQKANAVFERLEQAIAGEAAITVTVADVTLDDTAYTGTESHKAYIKASGTLTGNRNVIVPTRTKLYVVSNETAGAYSLTVKTSAGSGIAVEQGAKALLYCDGTNVVSVSASFGSRQTIWMPAGAMTPSTTNGAATGTTELTTNKNMLKSLDFDTATQEFAQFDIGMPSSWNEGTITFQPCWTAASGSGTVVFALQAVATSNDDAMDVAFGTEQTSTDTLITANDCHWGPESSAITVGGTPAAGDRVNFQVKRNVSADTLGVDAKLLGLRVYYTTSASTDA